MTKTNTDVQKLIDASLAAQTGREALDYATAAQTVASALWQVAATQGK